MATYRGIAVSYVEQRRKRGELVYLLSGEDGIEIAELSQHEYLSSPQLRHMGVGNGRHRQSNPQVHGDPAGQPYLALPPGTVVTWSPFGFATIPGPVEDAGIRAGEVTALRAWRVKDDRLFSVHMGKAEWRPAEPMTGDVRHEYGVHAFKAYDDLHLYLFWRGVWHAAQLLSGAMSERLVIGTVHLWGEIVEHERGYRAEFAKIASLDKIYPDGAPDDARLVTLRHRYGLAVADQARAA